MVAPPLLAVHCVSHFYASPPIPSADARDLSAVIYRAVAVVITVYYWVTKRHVYESSGIYEMFNHHWQVLIISALVILSTAKTRGDHPVNNQISTSPVLHYFAS